MEEDIYGDGSDMCTLLAQTGCDLEVGYQDNSGDKQEVHPDGSHFVVRLYKHEGASLGLSINETANGDALHISSVLADGLVDSWNQKCGMDSQLRVGDRIVKINDVGGSTRINDDVLDAVQSSCGQTAQSS